MCWGMHVCMNACHAYTAVCPDARVWALAAKSDDILCRITGFTNSPTWGKVDGMLVPLKKKLQKEGSVAYWMRVLER